MKIKVRLFAVYKEKAGTSALDLELDDGSTIGDAGRRVLELHPSIIQEASRLMVAVNDEYHDHDYVLHDNDEIALIPPVSGGLF
ncbi:MAG: molybdopterin converting factor subunit 1 [Chloroflexi bacterium]|nr:molybdopterin converting factor subunit 1 [Chloroflexota bacterium]MCH9038168.1 molybdopterin converting factor subunit 1 [Chloroflexota bacterium]MCI0812927.1 molybdopterin converting factor subunit 1 [Chloroflexota bacterium]